MSVHEGGCLCGAVEFRVDGDFENFFLCHCSHCRKDTGSAHAANLFSSSAELSWLCGAGNVTNYTLPGTRHKKAFCKDCGSALPNLQMDGRMVVVPAGSLNSPLDLKPAAHVFTASRADWDDKLEEIRGFEAFPG